MIRDSTHTKKLSMGCAIIDHIFKGGLPAQGIIEVAGEAGCGKTQFALQALISAILPEQYGGLGGAGFYLSTEGDFPSKRWDQLIKAYITKCPDASAENLRSNLYFRKVGNIDELWGLLLTEIKVLLRQKPVKLVVIDSIAAIFRVEYTKEQSIERARVLTSHAHELQKLSDEFKIPILVTNQVKDYFFDSMYDKSGALQNKFVIPALGLAWANCINTRIALARTTRTYTNDKHDDTQEPPNKRQRFTKNESSVVRTMSIIWSPHLPNDTCFFIIDSDGLQGIEP